MKNPLLRLYIILCCLVCFEVFAQPGHNPDPDPDLPCNFEISVLYGESGHDIVGEQEFYGICTVNDEPSVTYEVLHLPDGYTIQNYTPGSACIEVWGAAIETGVHSIIIAATTADGCQDTLTITNNYTCMPLEELALAPDPASLSHGIVSQNFDQKFSIEYTPFSIGIPFHFSIAQGSLPSGLILADSGYHDAYLRGIPTSAGSYTFTLRASLGNCASIEREYTLVIDENPECAYFSLYVASSENTYGLVGIPEYYSICGGGPEPVQFAPVSLLPGYTITSFGSGCGDLNGTVQEAGTFSMKVAGTNLSGCTDTLTITNTWRCASTEFDPYEFPAFRVGQDVHEGLLSATQSSLGVSVNYEITEGALPPGLSLQPGLGLSFYDGYITGKPTTPGIYTFTIRAILGTNCEGFTRSYTVEILDASCEDFSIGVVVSENTYGIVGLAEFYDICNTGNNEVVEFTTVSLLPGYTLMYSDAACADLVGVVTEPGTYSMTILGTTPAGCTDTLTITNTWNCLDGDFDPYEFPTFQVGQPVNEGLRSVAHASYGANVKYEVTAGALPPGLSLQPAFTDNDGSLTGTPTTPGIYTFTIRAYLGINCAGFTRSYTVQVLGGLAPHSLVLTPRCADSIAVRNWEIYNPNENAYILVDWELLYEPSYNGSVIAPPGYTTFQTPNVMNPNTIRIRWQDGITGTKTLVRGASSELCNPPACVIGASIVSYHQGFQKNGQAVPVHFSDPKLALGEPDASDSPSDPPRHFSLGYNGFIVLELSSNLSDQPGNDLTIHEMSFGDPSFSSHPERAEVLVSQNGIQWVSLGLTGSSQDCNAPLDKSFDLAGKITWCRYVKIVDKTDRHARILTPITCTPTSTFAFDGFTNGFDVDAVTCGSYTSTLASARIASEELFTSGATDRILYPNPVNDWVTIDLSEDKELTLPENRQVQVDIRDMSGRSVYTQLHTLDPDLTTRCNMVDFQSGLFVLHIRTPQGSRFYKLIKQ